MPLGATAPVGEHAKQWKAAAQIFMHLGGTPHVQGQPLAQHQQTGGVIHLAVAQQHRVNSGIPKRTRRLHGIKACQLSTNVRRGVTENPVHAVFAYGDG